MNTFFHDICDSIKHQSDSVIRESKINLSAIELIYNYCLKSQNIHFIEPPDYDKYKSCYAIRQSNPMVTLRQSDYRLPIDTKPYQYIAAVIEYQFPIDIFKRRDYHYFNNSVAPKFPHFVYINPETFNVCLTDYIEGTNLVLFNIVDYINYLGLQQPPKDWLKNYLKNKPFSTRFEQLINELLDSLGLKEMKGRISQVMGEKVKDSSYRYKTRLLTYYSLYQCYYQVHLMCYSDENRYWFINSYDYLPILLVHPERSLYTDGLTSLYTYYTMMRTIGRHKEFSQFLQKKEKTHEEMLYFTNYNTDVLHKLAPYIPSFVDNCKLLSMGDIIELTTQKTQEIQSISSLMRPETTYNIFSDFNNFRYYDY